LNNISRQGNKGQFGDDVKSSNHLPTNELNNPQYGYVDEPDKLTKLVHCAPIKIQGQARSHRKAIMNIDPTMKIMPATKTTFVARIWGSIGDNRRNRKATENLVSQTVARYSISLA